MSLDSLFLVKRKPEDVLLHYTYNRQVENFMFLELLVNVPRHPDIEFFFCSLHDKQWYSYVPKITKEKLRYRFSLHVIHEDCIYFFNIKTSLSNAWCYVSIATFELTTFTYEVNHEFDSFYQLFKETYQRPLQLLYHRDSLYLLTSSESERFLAKVWRYQFSSSTLTLIETTGQTPTVYYMNESATIFEDKLYFFASFNKDKMAKHGQIEVFDFEKSEWRSNFVLSNEPEYPCYSDGSGFAFCKNFGFLYTTESTEGLRVSLWALDIKKLSWNKLSHTLPFTMVIHKAVVTRGSLHLLIGSKSGEERCNIISIKLNIGELESQPSLKHKQVCSRLFANAACPPKLKQISGCYLSDASEDY